MKETVTQIQILSCVPLKVLSSILIKIFITKLYQLPVHSLETKSIIYTPII